MSIEIEVTNIDLTIRSEFRDDTAGILQKVRVEDGI